MSTYNIEELQNSKYSHIVTLLNYEISISNYLKEIKDKFNYNNDSQVLIDTALISGMNEYRFIELTDNINYLNYIQPDNETIQNANKILSKFKNNLKNSILSSNQSSSILSNKI